MITISQIVEPPQYFCCHGGRMNKLSTSHGGDHASLYLLLPGLQKECTQVLHASELEKGGIKCPHRGSEKVEQKLEVAAVASKASGAGA